MKKSKSALMKRKKRRRGKKRRKLRLPLRLQRREAKAPHQPKKAKKRCRKWTQTYRTRTIPTVRNSSPI